MIFVVKVIRIGIDKNMTATHCAQLFHDACFRFGQGVKTGKKEMSVFVSAKNKIDILCNIAVRFPHVAHIFFVQNGIQSLVIIRQVIPKFHEPFLTDR